jgi:RsiW-degrading membrane proteinase PrsW (M82 family)
MAISKRKKRREIKNKHQERKFFYITFGVTIVLIILLYFVYKNTM